jgi:hypothetical protein
LDSSIVGPSERWKEFLKIFSRVSKGRNRIASLVFFRLRNPAQNEPRIIEQ